jgi:hypothetical protein
MREQAKARPILSARKGAAKPASGVLSGQKSMEIGDTLPQLRGINDAELITPQILAAAAHAPSGRQLQGHASSSPAGIMTVGHKDTSCWKRWSSAVECFAVRRLLVTPLEPEPVMLHRYGCEITKPDERGKARLLTSLLQVSYLCISAFNAP